MVASLLFHAKRTMLWWRADVAFTIFTPLALLCAELIMFFEKKSRKSQVVTALYIAVAFTTAFAWRFNETIPEKNQGLFQLLVMAFPGLAFLCMLIARLFREKQKKKNILAALGVLFGIFGFLLLVANLQKENENTINWLYFCPNPFFSSLALGHMMLAAAIGCACFTYKSNEDSVAGQTIIYSIGGLIF